MLTGKKKKITVKHLAEMASGRDWNEWAVPYSDPKNIMRSLGQNPDHIRFVLDRPE